VECNAVFTNVLVMNCWSQALQCRMYVDQKFICTVCIHIKHLFIEIFIHKWTNSSKDLGGGGFASHVAKAHNTHTHNRNVTELCLERRRVKGEMWWYVGRNFGTHWACAVAFTVTMGTALLLVVTLKYVEPRICENAYNEVLL
jgi:hypothetical protein